MVKGRISSCVAVIRRGHRRHCQNKIVWNNVQLLCYCGFEWLIHLEVPLQPVSHFSSDPLFACGGGEICKVPRNDPCPATRLLFLFWPFLINSTSSFQAFALILLSSPSARLEMPQSLCSKVTLMMLIWVALNVLLEAGCLHTVIKEIPFHIWLMSWKWSQPLVSDGMLLTRFQRRAAVGCKTQTHPWASKQQ